MTLIERLQRLLTVMVITQGADSEYANDVRTGIERYQKMVDILKIIQGWASVSAERFKGGEDDDCEKEFRDIAAKAKEALNHGML